jgi:uncharacterized membrane protein YdjX (TVP38/TMEM64 family)
MQEGKPAVKKGWLIKGVVLGAVILGVGVLALRGVDFRALLAQMMVQLDHVMAVIRSAGPWVFFGAMVVLPAFGFPLLGFAIPVGPAFGAQMGIGGVLAAYGAALAVNLALTYWLARFAVRPLAERLLVRAGYKIPQFEPSEQIEVTLLVRITPGPPYFVQSYLLGLGNVAFLTYMWVSWIIMMLYAVGIVMFGKAVLDPHGSAGMAAMGVSLLVAVGLIVHLVRKHYYGKRRVQPGG